MSIIINIHARQIFDSRGNPTVEVGQNREATRTEGIQYKSVRIIKDCCVASATNAEHWDATD